MNIIKINPDIVRKGLSLYTIPSRLNNDHLTRISINDETVKEYNINELELGNVKIVLCNYQGEIDCVYTN